MTEAAERQKEIIEAVSQFEIDRRSGLLSGVSLVFSCLALVISGLSAYWNIIRQVDDVGLVIAAGASFWFDQSQNAIVISPYGSLAFTNSGNRNSAIVGVSLSTLQIRGDKEEVCTAYDPGGWTRLETDPVVVKGGEIQVVHLKPREKDIVVKLAEQKDKRIIPVEVCLEVEIVTPENRAIRQSFLMTTYSIDKQARFDSGVSFPREPIVLYQHWSTIFHPYIRKWWGPI